MSRVSKAVKDLVKSVFVQYDNSLDHGKRHIADVIKQSYLYGKCYKLTDKQHEILMVASVMHDFGLVLGKREDHEITAMNVVGRSKVLPKYFSPDEIQLIASCCLYHRSSQIKEDRPYHLLVKIVHDADNSMEIENIVMRCVATRMSKWFKDISLFENEEAIIADCWDYFDMKHGGKGYKKFLLELPPKRAKAWEESKRLIDTRDPKVEVLMWKYINKLKKE